MSRLNFLSCILIISSVKSIPPISSHVLKPIQNPFFNLFNPKSELQISKLNGYGASDRVLRNMGENTVVCEVSTTKEEFYEEGYEFHPRTYVNETCVSTNIDPYVLHSSQNLNRVICLHNDHKFGCQTLYEEINVWKKSTKEREECMEHTSQLVAVGCKCNIRFSYSRG